MAGTDTDLYIHELAETATDSGDLTTFDLYGFAIQDSTDSPPTGVSHPDPVVYVNGVVKTVTLDYTITKTTGKIVFTSAQGAADVVTCDYTWKLAAASIYDTTVFEFEQPQVRSVELDVNQKSVVFEPRFVDGVFSGVLEFQYVTEAMFEYFDHLYTAPNLKFDVYRTSLSTGFPYKLITNLVVMVRPKYAGIPGVPGCIHVNLAVQQLESV